MLNRCYRLIGRRQKRVLQSLEAEKNEGVLFFVGWHSFLRRWKIRLYY
ncbi:MAG: hypothetical protein R3C26_05775 [Calditrichia bacterium]